LGIGLLPFLPFRFEGEPIPGPLGVALEKLKRERANVRSEGHCLLLSIQECIDYDFMEGWDILAMAAQVEEYCRGNSSELRAFFPGMSHSEFMKGVNSFLYKGNYTNVIGDSMVFICARALELNIVCLQETMDPDQTSSELLRFNFNIDQRWKTIFLHLLYYQDHINCNHYSPLLRMTPEEESEPEEKPDFSFVADTPPHTCEEEVQPQEPQAIAETPVNSPLNTPEKSSSPSTFLKPSGRTPVRQKTKEEILQDEEVEKITDLLEKGKKIMELQMERSQRHQKERELQREKYLANVDVSPFPSPPTSPTPSSSSSPPSFSPASPPQKDEVYREKRDAFFKAHQVPQQEEDSEDDCIIVDSVLSGTQNTPFLIGVCPCPKKQSNILYNLLTQKKVKAQDHDVESDISSLPSLSHSRSPSPGGAISSSCASTSVYGLPGKSTFPRSPVRVSAKLDLLQEQHQFLCTECLSLQDLLPHPLQLTLKSSWSSVAQMKMQTLIFTLRTADQELHHHQQNPSSSNLRSRNTCPHNLQGLPLHSSLQLKRCPLLLLGWGRRTSFLFTFSRTWSPQWWKGCLMV
jgi:hypothetical protein